jgi:hypothetical protein
LTLGDDHQISGLHRHPSKRSREEEGLLDHRKEFVVATVFAKLCCNRYDEPKYLRNRRGNLAAGLVSLEKTTIYISSTRCTSNKIFFCCRRKATPKTPLNSLDPPLKSMATAVSHS